jgi:hypothetical protein
MDDDTIIRQRIASSLSFVLRRRTTPPLTE